MNKYTYNNNIVYYWLIQYCLLAQRSHANILSSLNSHSCKKSHIHISNNDCQSIRNTIIIMIILQIKYAIIDVVIHALSMCSARILHHFFFVYIMNI